MTSFNRVTFHQKALGLLLVVSVLIGATFLLRNGSDPSTTNLRDSLIHMTAAIDANISYHDFNTLVIEIDTKLRIANPHLTNNEREKCEAAVEGAKSANALWAGTYKEMSDTDTVGGFHTRVFYPPLRALGIVKNMSEFKAIDKRIFAKQKNVFSTTEYSTIARTLLLPLAMKVERYRLNEAIGALN